MPVRAYLSIEPQDLIWFLLPVRAYISIEPQDLIWFLLPVRAYISIEPQDLIWFLLPVRAYMINRTAGSNMVSIARQGINAIINIDYFKVLIAADFLYCTS